MSGRFAHSEKAETLTLGQIARGVNAQEYEKQDGKSPQ